MVSLYHSPPSQHDPMPPTPGERFCQHVSEYLTTHQLKSLGQIDRKQLASIYDDFQKKETTVHRPAGKRLDQEEKEWLDGLCSNPAYEGIAVRQEIEKCRTWSQINRKQCTKRRILAWLNRVERPLAASAQPGRHSNRDGRLNDEPSGWRAFLNSTYPDNCHRETAWVNLPDHAKKLVIQGMNK